MSEGERKRGKLSRGGDDGLEVGARSFLVRGGLVGDAPHDDAGMVPIPFVEGAKGFDVVLPGLGIDPVMADGGAAPHEMHPDSGHLVDDEDAVPVGEFEMLLGVGIVAGAERIRSPLSGPRGQERPLFSTHPDDLSSPHRFGNGSADDFELFNKEGVEMQQKEFRMKTCIRKSRGWFFPFSSWACRAERPRCSTIP
ncbi:MAG TPA: hypothetical protein VIM58_03830 [Candidatus Methylacidiphilales bacterium]